MKMLSAWAAEGFSPGEFWGQTVESWAAIMDGRRAYHENEADRIVASAWWQARLAREEMLQPIKHYLAKPSPPPTLEEMMAKWDALASAGYGITVKDMTVN